jgi:hypothetical protein
MRTPMSPAAHPTVTAVADRDDISALVFTYAERMDLGDFAGVAALFARATYRAVTGDGIFSQEGSAPVQAILDNLVLTYDGIPSTKHVTTNLIIDVADQTATCRSYYTVMQALRGAPLAPIVAGRYHDAFARDSDGWHFTDRLIFTDLVGDVSRHLRSPVLG